MKLYTFILSFTLIFSTHFAKCTFHVSIQQRFAPHRLIKHFGRLGLAENIQFVRRHIRFAVCQIMFIPATAAQTTTLRE